MTEEHVLALDVGGTSIKAALVAPDGTATSRTSHATGRERGPDAVVGTVLDVATELVREAAGRGVRVRAVGAALPGVVDETAGLAVFSANLGWNRVPLGRLLAERTGLPVRISHDIRAGAVAEQRLGAARGSACTVFLAIGTGVGAAAVLTGAPYTGASGRAMELGHLQVDPAGAPCGCGGTGCVETVASAPGIVATYRGLGATGEVTSADVARLAAAGDAVARAAWARALDALAVALQDAVTLLDPDVVVIGGGVAGAGEVLLAGVRERLTARLTFQQAPRLVLAGLGDRAGCVGAGVIAWDAVVAGRVQ